MRFSRRKISNEEIRSLRRVRVDVCAPNAILLTPIYVYLPKNRKFVAVKAPLQFFSPEELEKLRPFENFYLPEFVDLVAPFQRAGEAVRETLKLRQRRQIRTSRGASKVPIPMPQFELNDAVMRLVVPLWRGGVRIEPFFLCFFADELCDPLPPDALLKAAEENVDLFELTLLRASTAVFLALHLGYCDAKLLSCLRERVFREAWPAVWPASDGGTIAPLAGELGQILALVQALVPDAEVREVSLERMNETIAGSASGGRGADKLICRLTRVKTELGDTPGLQASLYGEKGIRDD